MDKKYILLSEEYLDGRSNKASWLAGLVIMDKKIPHDFHIASYILENYPELSYEEKMDLENVAQCIAIFVLKEQ